MSSPVTSSRCTCCHICHTSLKTSRRDFFPCATCPTIICHQCIELSGQQWDQVTHTPDWSCPRCCDNCPCKRCRNKGSATKSPVVKRVSRKRDRSPLTVFEDNAFSSKVRRSFQSFPVSPLAQTLAPVTDKSVVIGIPKLTPEANKARVVELYKKNQQCLDYISRTQRLLTLIRSQQQHIQEELECLAAVGRPQSVKGSEAADLDEECSSQEIASEEESCGEEDFDASSPDVQSSSADEYEGENDNEQGALNEQDVDFLSAMHTKEETTAAQELSAILGSSFTVETSA